MKIFHKHKWYTVGAIRSYVYKWCSRCGRVEKIFITSWASPDHDWEKCPEVPKSIADKISEFGHLHK